MDGEEWLAWADAETRQVLRFCQVKIVCLFGGGQTEPVKKGTGYDLTTVAVQGCMSHCTLVLDACYSYASPFCQNTVYRYFRGAWSPYISQQSGNGSSLLCQKDQGRGLVFWYDRAWGLCEGVGKYEVATQVPRIAPWSFSLLIACVSPPSR